MNDLGTNKKLLIDIKKVLMNLVPARNTTESLRSFMDNTECHLRSLEVLKENLDQHVFVSMIRSKLPSDVLLQQEILKGADNKWTIFKLRDLLRQYIVSKEKAEKNKSSETSTERDDKVQRFLTSKPNTNFKRSVYQAVPKYTSGVLAAREKKHSSSQPTKKCRFCEKPHWSDQCNKYKTIEERKGQLKGSCFKCLKDKLGKRM